MSGEQNARHPIRFRSIFIKTQLFCLATAQMKSTTTIVWFAGAKLRILPYPPKPFILNYHHVNFYRKSKLSLFSYSKSKNNDEIAPFQELSYLSINQ